MERITIQFQLRAIPISMKPKARKIIPFNSYKNIPISVCLQENPIMNEKIILKVLLSSDK